MQGLSTFNKRLDGTPSGFFEQGACSYDSPLCFASVAAEVGLEEFLLPAQAMTGARTDITEMVVFEQFTRWKLSLCATLTSPKNDVARKLRDFIVQESCPRAVLRAIRQMTPHQIEALPPAAKGLVTELRRKSHERHLLVAAGIPSPRKYEP
jgi:hypothetical protein